MSKERKDGSPGRPVDKAPQKKALPLREVVSLAEQAATGGLKVVPGKEWALHYPKDGEYRTAALWGLLVGTVTPEDVLSDLKPDALVYNVEELRQGGLEAVSGRIRDVTERVKQKDIHVCRVRLEHAEHR